MAPPTFSFFSCEKGSTSMKGKLIAACMTLAACVAFGVAATSAMAVTAQAPTGTGLAVGSKIQATNLENTVMTSLTTEKLIECSNAKMTGELVTNGPSTITGNITSASFSGTATDLDCTSNTGTAIFVTTNIEGGLPYCLKTIAEKDEFEIRGARCAENARSIKYTLDATGVGYCGYETSSLRGTFTTDVTGTVTDAVMTLDHAGPFTRYESKGLVTFFCPEKGVTLDMKFTLETDPTEGSASPIYIR
jgi:hypothetical protein